ncbi:MAG: MFS transporter [Chloroflexi bacterium]|nr:MFS transporter [Chloroflexota bacterium]
MTLPLINLVRRNWLGVSAVVRRNLILDFFSAIFYGIFLAGVSTFVPVIARRLGADPFLLSLIVAAPAVGNLIAVLASHYLQQRRKMPFMVAAWSIGRGLFLLMLFVTTPEVFVLIVVAHWLIVSLSVTGYVEVMRAIYPAALRGRAMAYVRVGFTACATIMTPLFGQWLDIASYQILFPIAAVFGILSGLSFGQVKYEEILAPTRQDWLTPLRIFARDARYRAYSIAFSLYGAGMLIIAPLIPLLLVDELNLSNAQVGWLGMINSIFWMLFYIVWGRSIDRRGGLWTVQINFVLTLAVPFAFFLAQDMWLLAVAQIFIGITVAGTDLGWMNAIMQFARKEDVSHYTALHAFLVGIRGVIAPFAGTALMTIPWIGLRGVFLFSAFLILAGWLLVRRVSAPGKVYE